MNVYVHFKQTSLTNYVTWLRPYMAGKKTFLNILNTICDLNSWGSSLLNWNMIMNMTHMSLVWSCKHLSCSVFLVTWLYTFTSYLKFSYYFCRIKLFKTTDLNLLKLMFVILILWRNMVRVDLVHVYWRYSRLCSESILFSS